MIRSISRLVALFGPVELCALALLLGTLGVWMVTLDSLWRSGCWR